MSQGGPYLQAALICEKVLQEQDGVVSAIRVIDRLVLLLGPDGQPLSRSMPVFFLIGLKPGQARGTFPIRIEREDPSTLRATVVEGEVFLEAEDRGVNLIVRGDFAPPEPGLYWYDIFFNDELLTRMPLRAIFQAQPTTGPSV